MIVGLDVNEWVEKRNFLIFLGYGLYFVLENLATESELD